MISHVIFFLIGLQLFEFISPSFCISFCARACVCVCVCRGGGRVRGGGLCGAQAF